MESFHMVTTISYASKTNLFPEAKAENSPETNATAAAGCCQRLSGGNDFI